MSAAYASHRYCSHEHTPAARAACRKAREEMNDPGKLIRTDQGFVSADGQFAVFPIEKDDEGNRYEVVQGANVIDHTATVKDAREVVHEAYPS